MDVVADLLADAQPPEPVQQGDALLDDPAMFAQAGAVWLAAAGDVRGDPLGPHDVPAVDVRDRIVYVNGASQFRAAGGAEGDLMVLGGWRSRQMLDRYGKVVCGREGAGRVSLDRAGRSVMTGEDTRRHPSYDLGEHAPESRVAVIPVNVEMSPPPRHGDPNVIDGRTVYLTR